MIIIIVCDFQKKQRYRNIWDLATDSMWSMCFFNIAVIMVENKKNDKQDVTKYQNVKTKEEKKRYKYIDR